jgi:hypothetical protein
VAQESLDRGFCVVVVHLACLTMDCVGAICGGMRHVYTMKFIAYPAVVSMMLFWLVVTHRIKRCCCWVLI